jgi:hypothetical protein
VPATIDEDQRELRGEDINVASRPPRGPVAEEAVQEHQWMAVPYRLEVDPHSVSAGGLHD